MHSGCRRYVLVFNGEIYNFQGLRAELGAKGASFSGHSDTEVLLQGLIAWGVEETLRRAEGMFAIALWDRQTRQLHLARDRSGEKPLYYGLHKGVFLFASELKAFHAWPEFRPEIDRNVLSLYLRHNYVPEPFCIYKGFLKLTPGTFLTLRSGLQQLPEPQPYWSLADTIAESKRTLLTVPEAVGVDLLDAALRESVRLRMIADVPLGAFLSGGIDSSTVVSLMQAQSMRPVKTFSIGFTVPQYDEAPYARAVAAHLGTEHTELYVSPEETQAVIPLLPGMYDEPFADSSQIPTYLVSQLARQQVTVAMSGDAGDELFAGYSRYSLASGMWQRQQRLPVALRRLFSLGLTSLAPSTWDRLFERFGAVLPSRLRQPMPGDKLHKLAGLLAIDDPMMMYKQLVSLWKDPASIVLGAHEPESVLCDVDKLPTTLNLVERMMALDALHYLPGDILAKVDRASMAVSLEARVPMLDTNVIGLAWRMPHHWKVRDGKGKWILREVLARYVPRPLFERPKMGFGIPIDAWLRGPLREWAENLLSESRLREGGYFEPQAVRAVWRSHLSGGQNLQYLLWGILCFEAWRERWGH